MHLEIVFISTVVIIISGHVRYICNIFNTLFANTVGNQVISECVAKNEIRTLPNTIHKNKLKMD